MPKKKIIIIAGVAFMLLVAALTVVSLLQEKPTESEGTTVLEPGSELSQADKAQIKLHVNEFVKDIGTYGWFANTISDPANAVKDESFFKAQNYTSADDVRRSLVTLTNGHDYDALVNVGLYSIPFSVETVLTGEISIPNTPTAEGGSSFVIVTIPVESTLIYVSRGISYVGDNGETVPGSLSINKSVFAGTITLNFIRNGSDWSVSSFKNDVGILPTDTYAFPNGDLITETTPVKNETIEIYP